MTPKRGHVAQRRISAKHVHDFGSTHERAKGHPSSHGLCKSENVGDDVEMLKSKERPGSTKTRLYLIKNEKRTGLIALFSERF